MLLLAVADKVYLNHILHLGELAAFSWFFYLGESDFCVFTYVISKIHEFMPDIKTRSILSYHRMSEESW